MDASVFTSIMFADLAGSATLYEQLGDEQAKRFFKPGLLLREKQNEEKI